MATAKFSEAQIRLLDQASRSRNGRISFSKAGSGAAMGAAVKTKMARKLAVLGLLEETPWGEFDITFSGREALDAVRGLPPKPKFLNPDYVSSFAA